MNSNKLFLNTTLVCILLGSVFLSWVEEKNQNPSFEKDWWNLHFEDPKSYDLDFIIENNSNTEDFTWEIHLNESVISSGYEELKKGANKTISIDESTLGNLKGGEVTIEVSSEEEKYSVSKFFEE